MSGQALDIHGIDALLDRFRARKRDDDQLRGHTAAWEVDHPKVLRPAAAAAMRIRFAMIASALTAEVSSVLRREATFNLTEFRTLRFRSYCQHQPERIFCFVVEVAELALPALVVVDEPTVWSMIDILVGGLGKPIELSRDLTRLEQRVVRDVISPVVAAHAGVLSGVSPLTMAWKRTLGSRDELLPIPSTEIYFLARYVTNVGPELVWNLDFLLPIGQLVPQIESSASLPVQRAEVSRDRRDSMVRNLVELPVQTAIDVGHAELSLSDVMNLAPGDVIVLDRKVGEPFDFLVEDIRKYRGTLGRCGRSLGFKVGEVIQKRTSKA